MQASIFKKATRKSTPIKIAITGPSGSGKTFSALRLSKGLGKKIALVDTENRSASLYSDRFDFDALDIEPPFLAAKYIEAIKAAEASAYDVLIIDSLSHAWAGDGGILDRKGLKDAKGGNSYTNWTKFTQEHEKLKAAILYSSVSIVACMRSKQDYVMQENDKGKQAPIKVGLAPVQREGMEYEFSTVFDIGMDHTFVVSKDRTGLFDGRMELMTEDHGKEIRQWLDGAPASISHAEKKELQDIMMGMGWGPEDMRSFIQELGYSQALDILKEELPLVKQRLKSIKELEYVKEPANALPNN